MKEGRGGHVILPNVRTLKFATHMGGPARLPALKMIEVDLRRVLTNHHTKYLCFR